MSVQSGQEVESGLIRISKEDVAEANRLSLNCPICANAVERNLDAPEVAPVACASCQTLYHRACWEQHGNRCATLGCGHEICHDYGTPGGPTLKIRYSDLPRHVPSAAPSNGRYRRLKELEKRNRAESGAFWSRLFRRILQAVGWR